MPSSKRVLRVTLSVAIVALGVLLSANGVQAKNIVAGQDSFSARLLGSNPTFSDEFGSPELDPKFFFDNPAPNPEGQSYSLTENPGFLRMTTTGPTDLFGSTNTAPKILENGPAGDFQIVSRVLALPDVGFEHAGVIVIQDSTHWVRLIRDSRDDSVYLQEGPDVFVSYVPFSGGDVVLRLTRTGSTYEAAFSPTGDNFTEVGSTVNSLMPTYIGMTIVSTPPGNVFTADFDYFRVFTDSGVGAVGGIAEYPDIAGSGGSRGYNYVAAAAVVAAALAVLAAGACYARRRWLR